MADENTAPVVAPEPVGSVGADDLGPLLADFDRQMGNSHPAADAPAPEQPQTPAMSEASQGSDVQRDPVGSADTVQRQLSDMIGSGAFDPRNVRIEQLEKFASDAAAHMQSQAEAQWRAIEKSEAEHVFSEAEERIAEYKLANIDARAWLKNELDLNAELASAWANRYKSDDAMHHARAVVNRAIDKLAKIAEREQARIEAIPYVEDREAVTAAVMRGSGEPPPPKPVKLGKMSDKELAEYSEKNFGYRPKALS